MSFIKYKRKCYWCNNSLHKQILSNILIYLLYKYEKYLWLNCGLQTEPQPKKTNSFSYLIIILIYNLINRLIIIANFQQLLIIIIIP